jgi:hypothetical protein
MYEEKLPQMIHKRAIWYTHEQGGKGLVHIWETGYDGKALL